MTVQKGGWDYFPGEYINLANTAQVTADNGVVYESGDISVYNYHIIDNGSGEAIDVYVSVDGTNYATTAASLELINDVVTGGGLRNIDLATTETGILRGKFKKIKVLMKGDAADDIEIGEVRIGHGIA